MGRPLSQAISQSQVECVNGDTTTHHPNGNTEPKQLLEGCVVNFNGNSWLNNLRMLLTGLRRSFRPGPSQIGELSRGEKMLYSGTDPESYITEYTSIYEEN